MCSEAIAIKTNLQAMAGVVAADTTESEADHENENSEEVDTEGTAEVETITDDSSSRGRLSSTRIFSLLNLVANGRTDDD
jgi:hypothetical protein